MLKTVDQAARVLASIAALLVAMSTLPATAQTLDEAMEAYWRGDYVTALLGLESYVKQDNAWAQYMIGVMYENGEALPRVFLDDNGVPYETAPSDKAVESVEIAAAAKQFTVLVECWK